MIWDSIAGRDGPGPGVVEEWGGIGYSLAALDASMPEGWAVQPLVKVGRDLAGSAQAFLRDLPCIAPGGRFVEVPGPNPRVALRYEDLERRCEGLTGGVPAWTWEEIGPMVLGLDALFMNFITGFECDLATMQALRRAFPGPIYGDIHSLALGITPDGTRYLRPVEEALAWLVCFDAVQLNEDEMSQLGEAPLALAARALEHGVGAVCVTLGPRGTVYVAAADFAGFAWAGSPRPPRGAGAGLVHTALLAPEGGRAEGDPTGCGDVFGGTMVAQLLGGAGLEEAIRTANRMARRNVSYRGATGLRQHLRGELQVAGA
jgi:sugar/nucleoside kinase (ribokinase family)